MPSLSGQWWWSLLGLLDFYTCLKDEEKIEKIETIMSKKKRADNLVLMAPRVRIHLMQSQTSSRNGYRLFHLLQEQ